MGSKVSISMDEITSKEVVTITGSTIGCVGGIIVAVRRQSGFWAGFGWVVLLGAAGYGIGKGINIFQK